MGEFIYLTTLRSEIFKDIEQLACFSELSFMDLTSFGKELFI